MKNRINSNRVEKSELQNTVLEQYCKTVFNKLRVAELKKYVSKQYRIQTTGCEIEIKNMNATKFVLKLRVAKSGSNQLFVKIIMYKKCLRPSS